MSIHRTIGLALITFTFHLCYGANADTVMTYSNIMKKDIKAVVFTPDNYSKNKPLPVVYLLHGYGGNYTSWAGEKNGIGKLADLHRLLIVCPDGGIGSWYFDSPVNKSSQYETYISKELVSWIDKNYSTIRSPKGRGITGLSMGGHGALYLAIRNPDIYGVAGSMSGGVDFRPFPGNWDIAKQLGSYSDHSENWRKNTVINMVDSLKPGALSFMFDCGTDDFFYTVNCQLHEKLLSKKIPHDFISRPGKHDWDYWKNAVQYQMLFMSNYFFKSE